jgi:DNA-binding Xre family transcriptional regulator
MIVYNKLGNYLKSKNMKYIDLQRELELSPSMTAKFTKNRTISTDTLNKVCEYLHV